MIGLALRMLFGERGKYVLLLSGICCSTILMLQGMALGFGILSFSYAVAENIRSPIWVVDPMVEQVNDDQPLRETDVDRVRSINGVAWAVPLYVGDAQVRLLQRGMGKVVTLVGLDATTLFGAPQQMTLGTLNDLRLPDAVIVDERATSLLSPDPDRPLGLGDNFEMNDHRAVIVGVCTTKPNLGGGAFVFTTFDRAVAYLPSQRKMVTHILAIPKAGLDPQLVANRIAKGTGLKAVTEHEIKRETVIWMLENSPVPVVVGCIVGIGFVVGTIVTGQTFFTFVVESSRYLGALRAMGTESRTLAWMILAQALCVGVIGFGLGLGFMTIVFHIMPPGRAPMLMLWPVPVSVLGAIVGICLFAALIGIRRISKLEPAVVFRG